MSFSGHVLAHHHFGVLEHLCPGDGALPAASLARRLPGDHQLVLRCPLHIRNVPQNVQLRVSGEKKINLNRMIYSHFEFCFFCRDTSCLSLTDSTALLS